MNMLSATIPNHIYVKIVDTEEVSELIEMKKKYPGDANSRVREAIDQRIENIQYHQGN